MSGQDKIRPGRITDAQVEAFGKVTQEWADANGAELSITDSAIRAGLTAAYVQREREIRSALTIETMNREQRIRERVRDLMDEIVTPELSRPDLDPYPASVGEVADEIARYVLELDTSGAARGVAAEVRGRLDARTVTRIGNPYLDPPEIMARRVDRLPGWPDPDARPRS